MADYWSIYDGQVFSWGLGTYLDFVIFLTYNLFAVLLITWLTS